MISQTEGIYYFVNTLLLLLALDQICKTTMTSLTYTTVVFILSRNT